MFDNVKKMTCLGVLDRGEGGDNNETSLKERGGIEMSTTVLPLRDARSPSLLYYLPHVRLVYSHNNPLTNVPINRPPALLM